MNAQTAPDVSSKAEVVVKLTTREAEYLDYRKEFTRFLESLRVLGY